ncbi:MAG: thioredoxin family protein [Balneolales bacterium]|nr:thioredoxin family protein [Balneolales bacterium]
MKNLILLLSITLLALFAWNGIQKGEETPNSAVVGEAAPGFTLVDSHGNEHSLGDFAGKFVVLEWLNHDCPFVRKFYGAGEMQRLQQHYTEQDVVWLSIISSREGEQGYMKPDQINTANSDKNVAATAVLIDEPGTVGRLYNARTTPHMFVINPDGVLIYDGAIDDKPTANPSDIPGARNYVAEALDAAMNGGQVTVSTTRPYGCSVKY